ncbi:MAG: ORF6N domain-containing protein [Victivallales bacterium]|nr:ORF6N domain-containing protein [Victivallales bacterium]
MRKNEHKTESKTKIEGVAYANAISYGEVRQKIISIRQQSVILDSDVAELYGVETKRVNEAVRNNPDKFPADYMFELTEEETSFLRSKFSTLKGTGRHSKYKYKAFTEKGLYMLATILKSRQATMATFAIIETFSKVRELQQELVDLHNESDKNKQIGKMHHFGEMLADIVTPEMETVETESTLELNFIVGKLSHTVRRIKKAKEQGDEES